MNDGTGTEGSTATDTPVAAADRPVHRVPKPGEPGEATSDGKGGANVPKTRKPKTAKAKTPKAPKEKKARTTRARTTEGGEPLPRMCFAMTKGERSAIIAAAKKSGVTLQDFIHKAVTKAAG